MKFTINKNALYKSLSSVGRAASTHSPLPILSGIHFSLKEHALELIASDSNISIREVIESDESNALTVFETGSVVLEARYILEVVRKLDAPVITVEIIDGALTRISGNQAEYNINGSKADLYPTIDFTKPDKTFFLDGALLSNVISQTAFVCSTSEDRPIFTGVNFKTNGQELNCIATDSYRLARKTIVLDEALDFNICIPASNLYEVQKTITNQERVEISVSDRIVQFVINNTLIQSRLIDGLFPDVNRLIPSDYGFELLTSKSDMISALDRSSFLKADGSWTVKLEASPQQCVISSKSQEIGSSEEVLTPLDYVGGNLKISFSGRYLLEALKSFRSDNVRILFVGEMQAFVLRSPGDDSIVQLILPLRTFE